MHSYVYIYVYKHIPSNIDVFMLIHIYILPNAIIRANIDKDQSRRCAF